MKPEDLACVCCRQRAGQPCVNKSGKNKGQPKKAPHGERTWEAGLLTCIHQHGSHEWEVPVEHMHYWGGDWKADLPLDCVYRCGAYAHTGEVADSERIRRGRDEYRRFVEQQTAARQRAEQEYLAQCKTLKWDEHYFYNFTLTPLDANPFRTHQGMRRYEVWADGKPIGRITRYGDEWAAYDYSIWDEYSQRIGFYPTEREACKALLG